MKVYIAQKEGMPTTEILGVRRTFDEASALCVAAAEKNKQASPVWDDITSDDQESSVRYWWADGLGGYDFVIEEHELDV